ncbi:MAG: hypothetical protein AAFV31_15310 [Pseudomonadota bacterium]
MNSELRMQLQIARTAQYGDIMRTSLFALIAVAAVVGLGVTGVDIPLAVLTVAITLFGAIGGGTALDDVSVLRQDMDEDTAGSAYGRQVKTRNLALLKTLSAALLGLAGLGVLLAIFIT